MRRGRGLDGSRTGPGIRPPWPCGGHRPHPREEAAWAHTHACAHACTRGTRRAGETWCQLSAATLSFVFPAGAGAGMWSLMAFVFTYSFTYQHLRKLPSAQVRWGPEPSPEACSRGGGVTPLRADHQPIQSSLAQKDLGDTFCLGTQEAVLHVEVAASSVF